MAESSLLPDLDELYKELNEIESKFTPKCTRKCPKIPVAVHENLAVLSKEFDSLGLPCINLEKSLPEILEKVVQTSRDLVQIHRNAVSSAPIPEEQKLKEVNKKIAEYQRKLEELEESCLSLKKTQFILNNELKFLKRENRVQKEKLLRAKHHSTDRESYLEHTISRLEEEVEHLKVMSVDPSARNEAVLELMRKHRVQEELNKHMMDWMAKDLKKMSQEIYDLKDEVILYKQLQYKDDE